MNFKRGASMTKSQEPPSTTLLWQSEKMLHAGDRIIILTDVQIVWSRYYDYSHEQELFRVGAYDARSGAIGFFKFGRDPAFDMLKGGVTAAPWGSSALPIGVEFHRRSHGNNAEGRFRGKVSVFKAEPEVIVVAAKARSAFRQAGHYPNANIGMWSKMETRAKRELAIEAATLVMVGIFRAGAIKKVVGKAVKSDQITRVLRRLVDEGRLTRRSQKTYEVAKPKIIPRLDWMG
jgi:hypothetical protein